MLPRKATDEPDVAHASSTNAEQSDCTSGYFSAEIEKERKNIKNCYKKFKENFCDTIKRIDQYRTDTPTRKWKPPSRCAETMRKSISNRSLMRSPAIEGRLSNSRIPCTSKEGETILSSSDSPLDSDYDSVSAMYGEEFVDVARRSRLRRQSRPCSRSSNSFYDSRERAFTKSLMTIGRELFVDCAERGQMGVYSSKEAFSNGANLPKFAEEMYYLGAIHLDQACVRSLLADYPPPPEFHPLPPIEKAAYIFYTTIYKKNYSNVSEFHRKFNREYFKYTCDGDSDVTALWKICKSMKDEYLRKIACTSWKTPEESSRRNVNDGGEEGNITSVQDSGGTHDIQTTNHSIIELNEAPLKYCVPHAFVTFGYLGKMVTVNSGSSPSVVRIDDVKTVLKDSHSRRLIDVAQTFRGPLVIGQTPTHSILLYIERQIRRISGCALATENSPKNEIDDCVLIWQLLRTLVQQQGRVTGPNLARLLLETKSTSSGGSTKERYSCREPGHNIYIVRQARCEIAGTAKSRISMAPDKEDHEGFINLLLEGHVTKAIESAVKDELYADAIIIARRVLAHDPGKLLEIEEQFFTTKSQDDPLVTLASVAASKPLPCLTSSMADFVCWRKHVAIILANLSNQDALNCVYELGKFLAHRNHNCAADFCFLATAVLTKVNPFEPLKKNSDAGTSKHIRLIHSEPADGRFENTQCRFGFSLSDFHATEIFDYATQLSGVNAHPLLSESLEFQQIRIQYAQLIADFGGFVNDAFRYCLEIAPYIRNNEHLLSVQELTDFCDMADRLKYAAYASADEMSTIRSLRSMEQERRLTLQSSEAEFGTLKTVPATYTASATPLPNSSPSQRFMIELDMAEPSGSQMQTQIPLCPGSSTPSPVVNSPLPEEDVAIQQSDIIEDYSDEAYITPSTSPIISSHQQCLYESAISDVANSRSSSNRSAEDVVSALQPKSDLSLHQSSTQNNPTSSASRNEQTGTHLKEGNCNGSKSFFEKLKEQFLKAIPSANEMILPDDREPAIVWDPAKGRYVDTEDTDEVTIAPPLMLDAQILNFGPSGLAAARKSRGSRYYNSWKQPSVEEVINPPSVPVPGAPLTTQFFIPTTCDDANVLVVPFSKQATMAAHEREVITAQ